MTSRVRIIPKKKLIRCYDSFTTDHRLKSKIRKEIDDIRHKDAK